MTPGRAAELYRTANTPTLAAELITARGRPDLAIYVQLYRFVPCAKVSAEMFRFWATIAGPTCFGWFERAEQVSRSNPPTLTSVRQLRAIFAWLGDVFDRYAPLQPPPPPEGPIVDVCETCSAPLRPGVDCCIPPVKRLRKRRAKMSR